MRGDIVADFFMFIKPFLVVFIGGIGYEKG